MPEGVVARVWWWRSISVFLFVLVGGFVGMCTFAVIAPWGSKLEFPLFRVMIASVNAVLGYLGACHVFNSTVIEIRDGELRTRHRGLPMFGFGPKRVRVAVAGFDRIEVSDQGVRAKGPDVDTLIVHAPEPARAALADTIARAAGVTR